METLASIMIVFSSNTVREGKETQAETQGRSGTENRNVKARDYGKCGTTFLETPELLIPLR